MITAKFAKSNSSSRTKWSDPGSAAHCLDHFTSFDGIFISDSRETLHSQKYWAS